MVQSRVFFLPHFPGLDIFLESLGLVKAWLQRTLGQLQAGKNPTWDVFFSFWANLNNPKEAREELAEKEKAAASCAFLHLPDEAPNGQSALARLP